MEGQGFSGRVFEMSQWWDEDLLENRGSHPRFGDQGRAAPPRNAHYCPHRFPRRVHGPPPNRDSAIATAAPVLSSPCDFATAFCLSSSLFSLVKIGIRFGPVTNGLRNSPTGSKGRYIQVLATRLVIASTGAMLIVGHEAPCRISALSCRIEYRR